jgi:hypothetical protein
MKIAVLGWGSLIWNSRNLKIKEREWKQDGPKLPVEFARISQDGRLTLVLYPKAKLIQVLWNYMDVDNLLEAIENLRKREGTIESYIGFIDLIENKSRCNIGDIENNIRKWAEEKDIEAVIWTDLPCNFKDKANGKLNEENVINYLKSLTGSKFEIAKEYIAKAPTQIRTKIRMAIEEKLGWF